MLAIREDMTHIGKVTPKPTPPGLRGVVQHTTIALPHSTPLEVIAVYAPNHPNNELVIDDLINYIQIHTAKATQTGHKVLLLGDFNSCFDELTGSTVANRRLMQTIRDLQYDHAGYSMDREPTFIGARTNSRLDEILLYPKPTHPGQEETLAEVTSDHALLVATTNHRTMEWIPTQAAPTEPAEWQPRFITPMKKDQLQQYKQRCETEVLIPAIQLR